MSVNAWKKLKVKLEKRKKRLEHRCQGQDRAIKLADCGNEVKPKTPRSSRLHEKQDDAEMALLENVLGQIEGFSESCVRARAKELCITLDDFLANYLVGGGLEKTLICDARSPIEFEKGGIPGAVSTPLFTGSPELQSNLKLSAQLLCGNHPLSSLLAPCLL